MNADGPTVSAAYSNTFYNEQGLYCLYEKEDLWYHADRHGANFWQFIKKAEPVDIGSVVPVWSFSSLSADGKN